MGGQVVCPDGTKCSTKLSDGGSDAIDQKSVQTEVDAGYEGKNHVVLIEAKNTGVNDIIIRQMYYPFRKWSEDVSVKYGKKVITVFFEKRGFEYLFWMYEFTDETNYNSIKLIKSNRYFIK